MAEYNCLRCGALFRRRGTRKPKYCSRPCSHASRPTSQFSYTAWYAANREDQNAKRRAWAMAHPEKRKEIKKKWRVANRLKLRLDAHNRRLVQRHGVTPDEAQKILTAANGHCTYCAKPCERLELDHVDAIAMGGSGEARNLVPCCRSCNAKKSAKDAADWLFDTHGIEGLGRAIYMLENRRFEPKLYHSGVRIVEVRG